MRKKIIYLDQVIGPLSIDIIDYFDKSYDVTCLYGEYISTHNQLPENVKKVKLNKYLRSSTLKRIWSWVRFFATSLCYLAFKKKDFKIFAITNPPLNIFTCLVLNLVFGIKYSLFIYDLYPDAFVSYRYAKENSLIIKFWRFLNAKAYIRAEYIYTISDSMSNKLADAVHPVKTIHMWADTHNIKPINKEVNWFRNELKLREKFVVLYSGNFGETHDLESVIQAAIDLRDNDYIHFLFIGNGKKKKMLKSKIEEFNLNNVRVLPFQDEQKFPYSITAGDVSLVTLDEKAAELSVPSKIFYYMAAGSAIITVSHPKSDLAQLVEKYSCGFNISTSSQMNLSECIIALSQNSQLLADLKQNSRRASKFHSPDNVKNIVI